MRTGAIALLSVCALSAAPAANAQGQGEPAPAGAMPDVQSQDEAIGPQPGPDRTLRRVENPFEMKPNVLVEGRRLFVWYNCAGCHGGRGGGGMGPSLRDVFWRYGHSDHAIYDSIAAGRSRGMPAWGTKLPREQIWKITAYIKSMGTPAEPKAPPKNPVYPDPPPRRDIPGREAAKGGDP